jgi:hypothetical protein
MYSSSSHTQNAATIISLLKAEFCFSSLLSLLGLRSIIPYYDLTLLRYVIELCREDHIRQGQGEKSTQMIIKLVG